LEELPKSVAQVPQGETNTQDLSPIKEAVAETAKAQSEDIKGLLAKHWKAYAQISTVILQHLDTIKQLQVKQRAQQEQQPQEHIHKHSFDIKSKKVFSFVSGLGVVSALSLWGNIAQWQSKRQYTDDALKFRAIRAWGSCTSNEVLWLNNVFDIQRDEKAIEWVRKQADGYDASLKAASDSLMQEGIKAKTDMQGRK
jgi:hypothetical protein